ncbi:hypothetical protein L6164_023799 [Bauhinia variegata]|uniref:Uncharacterized protein n=1 Tax=Bauhinia variegata TaxID=167791 RepID=A0ACB9MPL4_BAUVA|nr:hypothetical protein L6164_023799 [Bauhinia variegata]
MEGDATISPDGNIELNTDSPICVGRLTYAQPLRLWDSSKGVATDFSTRFSFTIADPTQSLDSLGDGFAFYMAPINFPIPPNSAGLYLGLFNSSTSKDESKNSIVFVEFDICANQDIDPSFPHVGINQDSLRSLNHTGFDIKDNLGKLGHALISFNATTEYLTVYWSFNTSITDFPSNCTLSRRIDFMKALPEWVTIGFTSSTGIRAERHIIHSWEFNSTLNSTSRNSTRSIRGVAESNNNNELPNMRESAPLSNPNQENSSLTQSQTVTTSFDKVGR